MSPIIPEYCILSPLTLLEQDAFNRWNFFPGGVNTAPPDLLLGHVIIAKRNDTYEVVIGHNHVHFAGKKGKKAQPIGCKIIPADYNNEAILQLILNYYSREISTSPLLKASFLKLCRQHFSRHECIQLFSNSFPGKLSPKSFALYEKLLLIDPHHQSLVHTGVVSEKILQDLLRLEKKDLYQVVKIIQDLQLGGNKQKQLLELLRDLCHQYNTTLTKIVEESNLQNHLASEKRNIPQISNNFFTFLREKKSPLSVQAQKDFDSKKKALKLPAHCDLQAAKSFEKDEVTFVATFSSMDSFKEKWDELRNFLTTK